jgi:hypothetical protein
MYIIEYALAVLFEVKLHTPFIVILWYRDNSLILGCNALNIFMNSYTDLYPVINLK